MSNFYSGSKIFQPVSDAVGLTVDQFNFMFCQLVASGFGFIFSRYLNTDKISPTFRHIIELVCGVSLTIFCFGSQIWHLLGQSISVYIMMNAMSTKSARYFILGFVLLFLSVAHLARMYYDYGGYTMDITGPLMIQTQKLSSLAFNLHDGQRIKKNEPLRRDYHRKHALLKYPTLLEFFSYMFYFHGIMVGPFVFLADYLRFIEGRQEEVLDNEKEKEYFRKNKSTILAGWPEIGFYVKSCLVFGLLTIFVQPHFDPDYFKTDEYLQSGMFYKYIMLTIVSFLVRQKYYFAWSIGSMSNIFSGLGFSGFSEERKPIYDVVKNFDFFKIELGTSTKSIIDNWNVGTIYWLRECVYDRIPRAYGTLAVFVCSSIWHGYYPGYYLCFMSLALFTEASRAGRKYIRPLVHKASLNLPYDVLTSLLGMLALNYCAIPFTQLEVQLTFYIWSKMFFIVHVGSVLLYFLTPKLAPLFSSASGDHSPRVADKISGDDISVHNSIRNENISNNTTNNAENTVKEDKKID